MRQGRASNPIGDLLDVSSRVRGVGGADSLTVATDARVGPAETNSPAGCLFTKRAFVQLKLDGLEIAPGRRFGDVVKGGTTEEVKSSATSTTKIGGIVRTSASTGAANPPEASAGAKLDAQAAFERKVETTSTEIVERKFVRAKGGDRWEISEGGAHLEGVYLQAAHDLCHLDRIQGSNRTSVVIEGVINRRDLDFKADRRLAKLTLNKEKAILALLASKLGLDEEKLGPSVTVCTQEFTDE